MKDLARSRPLFAILAVGCLLASASAMAAGPAFDCAKASSESEKLVCGSDALSALDRQMADTYRAAQGKAVGSDASRLKSMQRGWVKGRDDCWKADDKAQCTQSAYEMRIAELQARYALVPAFKTSTFACEANGAAPIVATFYNGEPLPSVRLVRGKQTVYGVLTRSGSGAKYVADSGISFWNKGDDALVDWPEGKQFNCVAER